MGFIFENQGSGSHLVYELAKGEQLDAMSLGMLTNNKIPGLISPLFTQMNTTEYLKYNVSSKISVKQFFMGTVNKKQLLGVFGGIAEAIISAEEYMINPNSIILDTEYIFSDVSSCDTLLICLPVRNAVKAADLKEFFREIMFNTRFDQAENCDHVAKIINFLNSSAVFSVYEFKKLLDDLQKDSAVPAVPEIQASVPQINRTVQVPQQNAFVVSNPVNVSQSPQSVQAAPNAVNQPYSVGSPAMVRGENSFAAPKTNQAMPMGKNMAVPTNNKMPSSGMKIPGMSDQNGSLSGSEAQQDNGEKISLMYLLQHYNKENAEKYKAQKKAKKAGSKATSAPPMQQMPNVGGQAPHILPTSQKNNFQPASGGRQGIPAPSVYTQPAVNAPQPVFSSAQVPSYPQQSNTPAAPVQANRVDFGETEYIQRDDDSETAFMMPGVQNNVVKPYLLSKRNNEKIPITKNIFRFGRDAGFNDYVIQNNKFVGHSHCHIVTEGGEYFIVDDNSKNRTFVDGSPIRPGENVKIAHGQLIKLADEEFEFRIF